MISTIRMMPTRVTISFRSIFFLLGEKIRREVKTEINRRVFLRRGEGQIRNYSLREFGFERGTFASVLGNSARSG